MQSDGLSVVVPIFNERENIRPLYESVVRVLRELGRPFEMIFVDDGSTDGSREEIARLCDEDSCVRLIEFRSNFGQTAALLAGFQHARGGILITLDGDLQNDPADIPAMLVKLEEGYDLVHGWRRERKDRFLTRRLPSRLANWLIAKVTGFPVHDLGCALKVMRAEVARDLDLYGEMHRFLAILAHWRGARCAEMVTRHHPRQFGQSKYGLSRTLRVVFDLVTVKCLMKYLTSPMKLFGLPGLACVAAGMISLGLTSAMKIFQGTDMTGNPLLLLSAVATLLGLQFFGMGLLGEIGVRIYYGISSNAPYAVRRFHNFAEATEKNQEQGPGSAAAHSATEEAALSRQAA